VRVRETLLMLQTSNFDALSPALAQALTGRGYSSLTPIQEAVLDPAHAGRDLRLFSQTGSGKTVAIGLVLAPALELVAKQRAITPHPGMAAPAAIIIAPTRELAAQIARELTWLFLPFGGTVCAVTGGTSVGQELFALRHSPLVVVGTPGRLLDHLERGAIDASQMSAVILDEADQMLDMGFREDLETILGKMPAERRTHLVAATFSREVRTLAGRYQKDAVAVEGTTLGEANQDITHVAHLVRPEERDAAIVNLLLLHPGERALVFVRTREGAADLADYLADAGFSALSLSGELEQRERTRTVAAFRNGKVTTLVATDVAARGLDIADVGRVIHADPPGDAETFVHRSGRTGRAGRKGKSVMVVPPNAREYVNRLYRGAGIKPTWAPAPTPEDVLREADLRLSNDLEAPFIAEGVAEGAAEGTADRAAQNAQKERFLSLAESLLGKIEPVKLVATLLGRIEHRGPAEPQPVTPMMPPSAPVARAPHHPSHPSHAKGLRSPQRGGTADPGAFVAFQVTWGGRHGADARRLLALVCRRGGIQSDQVGTILIGDFVSSVEVASPVAAAFAQLASKPDARDPRVRIRQIDAAMAEEQSQKPSARPKARKTVGGGDEPPKRWGARSMAR